MPDVQKTDAPKPRALSPREEAMAAVAAQRNAAFEQETGIKIEDSIASIDPDIDPEAAAAERERARLAADAEEGRSQPPTDVDAQLELQRQQDAAAAQAAADAATAADDATARAQAAAGIEPSSRLKLKVNGREVEMTGEEALRRLQKDVAADARLEEASRVMREAQALQQSLQAQQTAAAQAAAARTQGGNPDGVQVDADVAKKFTEALFKGDSEEATRAFNEAVSSAVTAAKSTSGRGNATPQVDPSAIAAQVRQQIAIDSALERSRADYPELYADPDVEALAAAKIARKVEGGIPFVTALDEVSTDMASKFGWKRAAGTPSSQPRADRRDEKLARKESLEQSPGGPSVKTSSFDEPQASVHDAIRDIAKSRGQQVVS